MNFFKGQRAPSEALEEPVTPSAGAASIRPFLRRLRRDTRRGTTRAETCREMAKTCPPMSLRVAKRRSNPDCLRGDILDCFASLPFTMRPYWPFDI